MRGLALVFSAIVLILSGCGDLSESTKSEGEGLVIGAAEFIELPSNAIDEPSFAHAPVTTDCIYCGRETGFLPSPVVDYAVGEKGVDLSWLKVEGADFYDVQWTQTSEMSSAKRFNHQTLKREIFIELEPGFVYQFSVVAGVDGSTQRSEASEPFVFEL